MIKKMEGIVGDNRGTLIKYNEVLKKLNIPSKYFIDNIRVREVFVLVDLITIEELKLGELIPNGSRTAITEQLTVKLVKEDFKKKFDLKYKHFNAGAVFKKKTTLQSLFGSGEELQYYLDKDSEGVYFWFSEEMEYSWRRKLFVGSF